MDFFKKNGKFLELGGFGLALLGVFLPFMVASMMGQSEGSGGFIKEGWGVVCLLMILAAAAVTAIDAFKPDIFTNLKNDAVNLVVKFVPLGLAGVSLLITLIKGFSLLGQARDLIKYYASYGASVHMSVGFYFMLLGLLLVIASKVIRLFVLKEAGNLTVNGPLMGGQQPMNNGPVMGGQQPQQPVMNNAPMGQPMNQQTPMNPEQPVNPNQNNNQQ